MIEFFIPGQPVGKGRPRAAKRGKHIQLYTPAKTVSYESTVALLASQAMAGKPPLDGPVAVFMDIAMAIPLSWSGKRQAAALAGTEWPVKKPDMDNCIKAIFDAMNGIVWKDDVQVVVLNVGKLYAQIPGVTVRLRPIQPTEAAHG